MGCKFCGNKTNENDPYPTVCESCYDEINSENPSGEWINYEWTELQYNENLQHRVEVDK